jgi:hypothetical protein
MEHNSGNRGRKGSMLAALGCARFSKVIIMEGLWVASNYFFFLIGN